MRRYSLLAIAGCAVLAAGLHAQEDRVETWRGKTIVVFTPHPDDDIFGCGGTLALAARNNKIYTVVYTNDNKGSYDEEMTSEKLARIRKAEEEASAATLGIPKENLIWLGYDDGELEYAEPKTLVGICARLIRKYRPDALLSIDPGEWYDRWHKSDHRMAAFNTIDAIRAAEFHLYYPEHLLLENLRQYKVPHLYFYYTAPQEANYWVNIDSVIDLKIEAAVKQVSQFEPSVNKYRPDWDPRELARVKAGLKARAGRKDGHFVETFRHATGFNQQ